MEICALSLCDIEGDIIHINKAKVLGENGEWIIKTTKATASTRDIVMPPKIINQIKMQGYVYKGHPHSI